MSGRSKKIKLYTYQLDEFFQKDDDIEVVQTKEYAELQHKEYESFLNLDGKKKIDNICTPLFTSYSRACASARCDTGCWFFIIEYRVSLTELENLLQDNHEEKLVPFHKLHPIVFLKD